MSAMANAYLQVAVFVVATLAVFYASEKLLKTDLGTWMARSRRLQPAIAALLGGASRLWWRDYRRHSVYSRLCELQRADLCVGLHNGRCGIPAGHP